MRKMFLLLAVALALPLATAFNCTGLDGVEYRACNYIEDTDWPQFEKDTIIQDMIDSGSISFDGNFDSILNNPTEDTIQLNKLEEMELGVSDENKRFLIDFSSISIFGYVVYSFLKKYYLLLKLL